MELICLSFVWTALKDSFGICFSQIPVRNLSLLADADELIIIQGSDWEAVNTSHTLLLCWDSLFSFQVPTEDGLISGAGEKVLVIWEELNFSNSLWMFFQMRYQFSWSDFPDADFSLHATGDYELSVWSKTDCGDTSLVSVLDLPKELTVIHPVSSDTSVRPTTNDNLISKYSAMCEVARSSSRFLAHGCDASRCHCIVVGIPNTNSSILACSDKLIRSSWNEPAARHWMDMILWKKHLAEVIVFHSIEVTFISSDQALKTIWTWS